MNQIVIPKSTEELIIRANKLARKNIGDIANNYHINLPNKLNVKKGIIGQVLEIALGASAGNKPIPDFPNLGIELKTIPVDEKNIPLETTYICTAPIPFKESVFENSIVYKKMSKVLWFPYTVKKNDHVKNYVLSSPVLWSPNSNEYNQLKNDWEELADMLGLGQFASISSHIGKAMQLRPKAANKKQTICVLDENNELVNIVPKGFYLRKTFTQNIIA